MKALKLVDLGQFKETSATGKWRLVSKKCGVYSNCQRTA